jgi:hypothetical protein
MVVIEYGELPSSRNDLKTTEFGPEYGYFS